MTNIKTRELSYTAGDVNMLGHLAWDDNQTGPRPGVLVLPEWWGRNAYARGRAEQLAAEGYAAMAVDLYGGGREAASPDEAGAQMNALIDDMATCRARFSAALDAFVATDAVDAQRVAAIGFCFGGGVVVHMARAGLPLHAVASFHGSVGLAQTEGPEHIECRVAAYNGEQDVLVAPKDIEAFQAEMQACYAHYYLVQLPGALHGFSNPAATQKGKDYGLPLAFDRQAEQTAWNHMHLMFRDVFGA